LGMPSRRTNNFPESGRGLGHVTPTIFGSTVGYPSDSLASCRYMILHHTRLQPKAHDVNITRDLQMCHYLGTRMQNGYRKHTILEKIQT